jgi:hypothetical protein
VEEARSHGHDPSQTDWQVDLAVSVVSAAGEGSILL